MTPSINILNSSSSDVIDMNESIGDLMKSLEYEDGTYLISCNIENLFDIEELPLYFEKTNETLQKLLGKETEPYTIQSLLWSLEILNRQKRTHCLTQQTSQPKVYSLNELDDGYNKFFLKLPNRKKGMYMANLTPIDLYVYDFSTKDGRILSSFKSSREEESHDNLILIDKTNKKCYDIETELITEIYSKNLDFALFEYTSSGDKPDHRFYLKLP